MRKQIILFLIAGYTCVVNVYGQGIWPDASFGTDGLVLTDVGSSSESAVVCLVQPDAKIVIGGITDDGGGQQFLLIRYNPDGSLDNSFSTDGIVKTSFSGDLLDVIYAMALQSDGKIIAAGRNFTSGSLNFAIARYNPDGSLDNSFSDDGKIVDGFGFGLGGEARAVNIQPDGKIVVSGTFVDYGINSYFAVVRYNTDGTLDESFSDDGIAQADFITADVSEGAISAAIQADGKILLAGYAHPDIYTDAALARFNSDGTLDETFGTGGLATASISMDDYIEHIELQADGKIVAACNTYDDAGDPEFGVARFNTDGTLDNTFSDDGFVIIEIGENWEAARSVVIQADGKIIAAGYSEFVAYDYDFAMIRYNTDGNIDTDFGTAGIYLKDINDDDFLNSVIIQPDDKVLAAGSTADFDGQDVALLRFSTSPNVAVSDLQTILNTVLTYPNPVNTETQLQFTLNNKQTISIELIDLQGKIVQTFMENNILESGMHIENIQPDASIPAGDYIIRISSPTGNASIKITKM